MRITQVGSRKIQVMMMIVHEKKIVALLKEEK